MRICFPLPPIERYSPVSGGAIATCVMQVARGLIARGHEVTVLADNHGDEAYGVGKFVPVRLPVGSDLPLWRRGLSKLRYRMQHHDWPRHDVYLRAVTRAIRRQRVVPDVIVVENDLHTPRVLRRAFPDARQVLWLHNEQGTRHPTPRALFDAVDHVITNSGYIRRYTQQRYGLPEALFSVVHNGVDREAFHPREDFDAPRSPVRVLFLGRIDPNKGVDLAVDAVGALRDEGLPIEMTVAGGLWFFDHGREMEHPYFRELHGKMQRAAVTYRGHVPRTDVPKLVREHDVVCVLSRSNEPFGLVALEAMASGCAVLASDRGGLPEACGGAATLVDVDRLDRVIDALRAWVLSPEALRAAKRAALARAQAAGWDVAAMEMEHVLQRVCGEERPARESAERAPAAGAVPA